MKTNSQGYTRAINRWADGVFRDLAVRELRETVAVAVVAIPDPDERIRDIEAEVLGCELLAAILGDSRK